MGKNFLESNWKLVSGTIYMITLFVILSLTKNVLIGKNPKSENNTPLYGCLFQYHLRRKYFTPPRDKSIGRYLGKL